tara:strand:- start:879 stop:1058 length:180 start_codon:yes stop_codon:yes gene_type:complete
MTEIERLKDALSQVENLSSLLENNEWENYLYKHLIPLKCELQRQLSLLTNVKNYPSIEQ